MAGIGHNGIAKDQLRSIVERVERLEGEKAAIAEDIKEVYAEAKANGYDTKTLRAVVRIRKQDTAERAEQEALLDLYLSALGMLADTPLGEAALERAGALTPDQRRARAKARMSESMDDNKALSAELVAAGLISEEAHAENVKLSDAVARKMGAGVI